MRVRDVIADLSGGDEQVDRSSLTVADGMQLGVHAAFGSTDQTTTPPFFAAMLVAVRWALRYVASIITVFSSPCSAHVRASWPRRRRHGTFGRRHSRMPWAVSSTPIMACPLRSTGARWSTAHRMGSSSLPIVAVGSSTPNTDPIPA